MSNFAKEIFKNEYIIKFMIQKKKEKKKKRKMNSKLH